MDVHDLMALFVLLGCGLLFVYWFYHGERIQHNEGLGWDGAAYADWAQRDTLEVLRKNDLSEYYVGRILPSLVVHFLSKWLHYDIGSPTGVIRAFFVLNCALLCGGIALMLSIARHYGWRRNIAYLAVSGFLFNYAVLTNLSYNPTLTDISGYVLGLAIIWAYLRGYLQILWLLSLVSGFVWPTMIYGSFLLIAFGHTKLEAGPIPRHAHVLALANSLFLLVLSGWLYFVKGLRQTPGTTELKLMLLPLCALLYGGYLYLAELPLINVPAGLRALRRVDWRAIVAALVLVVAVKWLTSYFSDHSPGPLTIVRYIGLLTQASLANPLVNAVAHAMHYGPFYLLAVFLWRRVAAVAWSEGLGLTLFTMLFAALSIGSESRQFLNAWPVLIVLVCQVLHQLDEQYRIDWWFTYSIAGMGLILSRCWLRINVGLWTGDFQNFPDQMLYMYTGPWMSNQMYQVFLAVTLLCSIGIAALLRKLPVQSSPGLSRDG
ncbi:hypothetical protein IVA98_19210 [Bradyrhizobium sp. 160]|uniref:hypothetical protein n=1 Tax=unclassified Bradyrhizobium TaxID=2631580 RepID=UPI001FF95756|nr:MULTISPECIES: hypothetical protein [unclassified Bradyrhizobium]MCK1545775.1 hypothetical protein [Bradyrhizobium sp. 179]MCK1625255.1 hypothetical protein [Bradyrhizobium sp. 160]